MPRTHQIIPIIMTSGQSTSGTVDLRGVEGGTMIIPTSSSLRVNIHFIDHFAGEQIYTKYNTLAVYATVTTGRTLELFPALVEVGRLKMVFNTAAAKNSTILFAVHRQGG